MKNIMTRMRMRMRLWIKREIFFWWYIKMSYYWFNRQEILQKAKEKYSKEKAAEYYLQNKEAIKEKARDRYKNRSEEKKNKIKEYQKKKYQELVLYKNKALREFINLNKQLI